MITGNFELAEDYEVGGFHPVAIGDVYNDRYTVVNKLDIGMHSTVWLALDQALNRYCALKIVDATASLSSYEMLVAQRIKECQELDDHHPGKEHVVRVFDTFEITGPNGVHQCIVTEVLGTTLAARAPEEYQAKQRPVAVIKHEGNEFYKPEIARKLAKQIPLGVAWLHKCGIVHGDLNIGNVLFHSDKLKNLTSGDLDEIYRDPKLKPLVNIDGADAPLDANGNVRMRVVPKGRSKRVVDLCASDPAKIHVKLCGFGGSFIFDPPQPDMKPLLRMQYILHAPEIIFEEFQSHLGPGIDVWALGVLLYMILNETEPPFPMHLNGTDDIIGYMADTLGKLPDKWWSKWDGPGLKWYFNEDGAKHYCENVMIPSRDFDCLALKGSPEEEQFKGLLRKILCYNPDERITADDVAARISSIFKYI